MSSKSNESEPISVEKLRSNYPDISCLISDNSGNATDASSNDPPQQSFSQVTVTQAKASTTQSSPCKVLTTTVTQKKTQLSPGDRKVPPYVNALPQDPVRVKTKIIPKPITEKMIVTTTEAAVLTAQSSSNNKAQTADVKKMSPQFVRANTTQMPAKPKSYLNVSTVSTSSSTDESKSNNNSESSNKTTEKVSPILQNRTPQLIARTSDVFEKNIQSNILTVTPRTFTINKSPTIKVVPAKDAKPNLPESTTNPPNSPKITPTKPPILSTESLCKNNAKSVSIQCADSTSKSAPPRVISTNSIPKSDASKCIISKAVSSTDTKTTNKFVIAVTSSDSMTKCEEKSPIIAKNIIKAVPSNQSPSATKTVPKSPSPSVSTSPTPKESFVIPTVPSHISNNKNLTFTVTQTSSNLQLSSLSELENNKDLREALNSGSTACVGENVTISSAGAAVEYYLVHPVTTRTSEKIRNVSSETTIETITKQSSNPNSPAARSKNGNANESVSKSPKPDSNSSCASSESRHPKVTAAEELDSPIENNKSKKLEEPECLTISSDEETEPEHFVSSLSDNSDVSVSIMNKEPPIERDEEVIGKSSVADGSSFEKEIETQLEITSGDNFTNLSCRTVRIGSYKVVPRESVTLSKFGLRIVVPAVNNPHENVALKIPIHDITKVLVHFNRSLPVIFYYVTALAGARVRKALKMTDSSTYYFDPSSEEDESHRRITLLPEKFTDANKINISELYLERDVLDELSHGEANQLLVKSAPKEVQKVMKQVPPNPVQTIMVFPPPPVRGGISINTEDYSCLAEDVFLNDVIIDFYLKFLYHKRLTDEDRQKTHIFSSFFYKRLTDKATPVPKVLQNVKSGDSTATRAEIRHSRVKNWTKNIDIFSKDYIVIPLNENQHWFLAIICFPGLKGPVRYSDNTPIDAESSKKSDEKAESNVDSEKDSDSQTMTIGSTTITPLRTSSAYTVDEDGELEDRDEADGADEDDNIYTSSEDSDEDYTDTEVSESGEVKFKVKKKLEREPIKQPCILIFDSLAGASRSKIIATLRDYLHVEYKMKHNGEERDFTKNVVKGACPRVPQQTNYTDCGLYVLQYVETFFDNKITDFHIPIRALRHWFSSRIVSNKRYEIQQLLLQLMKEQNINVRSLHLPELNLSPHHRYYDSEELDELADGDYYGEGELEHYEYEELEIREHDARMRRNFMDEDVDDGEYIDEEEEIALDGRSKYGMYDTEDESQSEEGLTDDDIMYKDLDEDDEEMIHRKGRSVYRVTTGTDGDEEIIHEAVEEEEEEEEEDDVEEEDEEHELTNVRISSLNKENVTISRMPSNSDKSQSESKSSTLAELKAARPFKKSNEITIDKASETGCPPKKFRPN